MTAISTPDVPPPLSSEDVVADLVAFASVSTESFEPVVSEEPVFAPEFELPVPDFAFVVVVVLPVAVVVDVVVVAAVVPGSCWRPPFGTVGIVMRW
jgi:hypothetical protein